jgi:hypothetical protein
MGFNPEEFKDDADFQAFLDDSVKSAVDETTLELKSKIDELIGEKRSIAEKMREFEGIDIEKAKQALEIVEKNDVVKRIADGKFDEILEEQTDQLRAQFESEKQELMESLTKREREALELKQKLDNTIISDTLRSHATKAGVLPDAVQDVLIRGRQIFGVSEDGKVEARDEEGKLRKIDGKVLTIERWLETLPKHYWPSSESVFIKGSAGGSDYEEKLTSALKRGDMALYRKLRKAK